MIGFSSTVKLALAFTAALLVTLAAVLTSRTIQQSPEVTVWTQHSHETTERLAHIIDALNVEQSNALAYVLTGEQAYSSSFDSASARLKTHLAAATLTSADNAHHRHKLDSIQPVINRQELQLRAAMTLRQAGHIPAASRLIAATTGVPRMAQIRRSFAAIDTEERAEVDRRLAAQYSSQRWALVSTVAAALGALTLLLVLVNMMRADLKLLRFTARERDLLLALEHKAVQQLERIQTVVDSTLSHLSLNEMLEELVPRLCSVLGADHAFILLVMRDGRRLEVCATGGPAGAVQYGAKLQIGEGVIGRIAESRTPLVITDLSEAQHEGPAIPPGARSLAGAPLIANGKLIGVVYVASLTPRSFSQEDLQLLTLVAERAATAIDRGRLYEAERRRESHFRLLIDGVSDHALVLLDADGCVRSWNNGGERVFGYEENDVIGQPLSVFYTPEDRVLHRPEETLSLATETGRADEEGWRVCKDESRFWAGTVLSLLRDENDNHLLGYAMVTRDLTERKRAQQEVLAAKEAAEMSNRAKSQFLATMSHEIRTPLNAISGYAELLELGLKGALTEPQQDYVGRVRSSSKHLLKLVNELLDLAKIEAGQLQVVRVAATLRSPASAVLSLIHPQAKLKNITISRGTVARDDVPFVGDEHRVEQIVLNLLSNAVKFTPEGGTVTLETGLTERPDAPELPPGVWAYARVRDTGVGLMPDQLDAVFEPFVQVGSAGRQEVGGSGLGLTISRRLARLMGGDVTAASTPGQGASFTLWLPSVPTATEVPDAPERRSRTRTSPGLAEAGAVLMENVNVLLQLHDQGMRDAVLAAGIAPVSDAEMNGHIASLAVALGESLDNIAKAGGEASPIIRDSAEMQKLIAERHGSARHALGWSDEALREEFVRLRAEIESILRRRMTGESAATVASALEVVAKLLEPIERSAMRGLHIADGSAV